MPAPEQAGILSGMVPTHFNPKNPVPLFIIQVTIIIAVTRALNLALSRIRQPRVISEVIGGIILGPSVFGQIPGFNGTIFPPESLSYLSLVANLGLILYLFLVGVELDLRMLRHTGKLALAISAIGMILPFGLGAAVAYGLYELNNLKDVTFPNFLLFMGVAMAITAFPVLARIVTELKLLRTKVGLTALCAAVGDDVTAWILLALVVSILNSTNSLNALYVFFLAVAWTLILFFAVRPILLKLIVITGSNQTGPTLTMMSITLLLVLVSAFVTDIIGVHAIFGGFMVGVIIPHDGAFAIRLTERMEDLVGILFLPIYFALSGLKTEIGLLSDAASWGYVILTICVAMLGKITGVTTVAKLSGMTLRESLTIGVFMSCKGLVELIVLNIGLDAGVISPKVFVIMVMMAIITTVMTTPLVTFLYPPKYQVDGTRPPRHDLERSKGTSDDGLLEKSKHNKILVVLNQVEYLPAMMTLLQFLRPLRVLAKQTMPEKGEKSQLVTTEISTDAPSGEPITVTALRLIELTQRISTIVKFNETENTILHDPIMNVFRTFGQMNFVNVKANLKIARLDEFSDEVADKVLDSNSELVIIPWAGAGAIIEDSSNSHDNILGSSENKDTSPQVANFVQGVFNTVRTNIGILVDRGLGLSPSNSIPTMTINIFLPFFGGLDDREALKFVVRLLEHPNVSATILRIQKSDEPTSNDITLAPPAIGAISGSGSGGKGGKLNLVDETLTMVDETKPTLKHQISAATIPVIESASERQASDSADEAIFTQYFGAGKNSLLENAKVKYQTINSATPLQTAIDRAKSVVTRKDLVVIGRGRHNAAISHHEEWSSVLSNIGTMGYSSDNLTRRSLGNVGESFLVAGVPSSVLVWQGKRLS